MVHPVLQPLRGGLVVSCQALPGEPMYSCGGGVMPLFAEAARRAGAVAIRSNSGRDIAEIKAAVPLPVSGLVKQEYDGFAPYITVSMAEAPEHPWPGPPDDCWRALRWMIEHGAEFGVDGERLSAGGSSAGACLAAATAIRARDEGVRLKAQVLDIPVTDLCSVEPVTTSVVVVVDGGKWDYVARYVRPEDARAASPLHAQHLTGMAPASIVVAEYDQLLPDGLAYAERLREARVPTRLLRLQGQFHGSGRLSALIPREAEALDQFLVQALV